MGNNRQGDLVAGIECETGKGSQLSSGERLIPFAKFRLDRPILAELRTGDYVDAFVEARKIEPLAYCRRHVAQQPDVCELRLIFWRGLQIKLREAFKRSPLLTVRKALRTLPELAPRCAGGDKAILPMHLGKPRPV